MPPDRQPTQKRRHLPFKPPSRASASTSTTAGPLKPATTKPPTKKTTKTNTTASSSKSKPNSRITKPSKPSPSPSPSNSPSNNSDTRASSPENSSDLDPGSADEANYILAEISHVEPATEDVLSSDPLIPPKLLTKLVHHHFRNEKTKIAKDANAVVAKYIDVFVREAVARAAFEREEGKTSSKVGDGFLEVEDLEKMGPQLAMDF